jgi:hypothetical protein
MQPESGVLGVNATQAVTISGSDNPNRSSPDARRRLFRHAILGEKPGAPQQDIRPDHTLDRIEDFRAAAPDRPARDG